MVAYDGKAGPVRKYKNSTINIPNCINKANPYKHYRGLYLFNTVEIEFQLLFVPEII